MSSRYVHLSEDSVLNALSGLNDGICRDENKTCAAIPKNVADFVAGTGLDGLVWAYLEAERN